MRSFPLLSLTLRTEITSQQGLPRWSATPPSPQVTTPLGLSCREGTGRTTLTRARSSSSASTPIGFDKKGPYPLPVEEGSAAQQAEALLPETRVTAAFHNVSAVLLADLDQPKVDCDVLVLGDDREATDVVRALADAIPGVRGVFGGRLRNAYQVECLTANLIAINRRYKVHAGIKITDLDG